MTAETLAIRTAIRRDDFVLAVDLEIPLEGISAVYGKSGTGKTSLFRAISGLDRHRDSTIKFGDIFWQSHEVFLPVHKRRIGYVFQGDALLSHLNVEKNLKYAFSRSHPQFRNIRISQAVDFFRLENLLGRLPAQLSGGENRRVAMARAVASNPALLLMDEPLNGLDAGQKESIIPLIDGISRNFDIPVLYISHDSSELVRLARRMYYLRPGGRIDSGPVRDMLTDLSLPLAHDSHAISYIQARVTGQDTGFNLSYLEAEGQQLTINHQPAPTGSHMNLRIAAHDVSICLSKPTDSSIQNIVPVTLETCRRENTYRYTLLLRLGTQPLLAHITAKSFESLKLHEGKQLFAQVKTMAVDR